MTEPEPMLDVARGDVAVSRQLSAALRAISRSTADPMLKEQIGAVLAGRASVRDLAAGEAFSRVLDGVMPRAMAKYAALSDEERARLAEQERQELERYRHRTRQEAEPSADARAAPAPPRRHVVPGTRAPDREQVVTPDEPDDDDRFFQERNRHGWLT